MNRFFMAFLLAALSGLAGAQTAAPQASPENIDAERAKISAERVRLEAGFLTEDAACYEKFAINSCLGKVNSRRREAMASLRRQEILLNDEERKIRGAQGLRRIEEKSSPENLQEAADRRARAAEDYQSRLEREKIKQQERASAPAAEKAAHEASAEKLLDRQKKARSRTDKQAAAAEEAKKFEERQKQAQEHRAQHERDQLSRPQPPVKSLPLPN
jgi:colicin import membrane protein